MEEGEKRLFANLVYNCGKEVFDAGITGGSDGWELTG